MIWPTAASGCEQPLSLRFMSQAASQIIDFVYLLAPAALLSLFNGLAPVIR